MYTYTTTIGTTIPTPTITTLIELNRRREGIWRVTGELCVSAHHECTSIDKRTNHFMLKTIAGTRTVAVRKSLVNVKY